MTQRQPVTPHDLFRFHPTSDLQLAPDGSVVAYVVQDPDLEINKIRNSIWLAPVGGGAPHRLTNPADGSDRAPRWSPDGTTVAFVSDRKGKPQLWLINVNGGEARCLETRQRPTGEPVWSPDGTQIAFTAMVFDYPADWAPYPGAPAGDRRRAEEAANHEPGPDKKNGGQEPSDVKVITRLRFRMDGVGYFGDKRSQVFVIPADGSAPARQVTSGDFDHTAPCWTPDGRAIIVSARRSGEEDPFVRSDLWQFDVASGDATLVYECAGPAMAPAVSPDGRYLAFLGHGGEHRGSTTVQLMLLDLGAAPAERRAVSLTAALDRPVSAGTMSDTNNGGAATLRQWSHDSRGLYFLLCDRGDANLYYAPVDGSQPVRLTHGEGRRVSDFAAANGTLALLIADGVTPERVFVLENGDTRLLADHNPAAAELDLIQPERFTYQGADGWPVDGWVIRPAGYEPGKRYPTVLAIHGGPHDAFGSGLMIMYQCMASAGMAVMYTNPRGSQTYGQDFALAVVQDWGGKDFEDIMAGVDAVIAMGIADPDRLGVMGWSYGGFMTSWTVTHTDRFKAAITGAPVIDNHAMVGTTDIPWFTSWQLGGDPWTREGEEKLLDRSPIRYVGSVTTPTMVIAGEGDLRCPISQAEAFYMALRRLGRAPAVHIRYPGEFHGIAKPKHRLDRYERQVAWFKHFLMESR